MYYAVWEIKIIYFTHLHFIEESNFNWHNSGIFHLQTQKFAWKCADIIYS